jgi:hypothetical protein
MDKDLKINILLALKNGLLSKGEAKDLIRSKGVMRLDLSTNGKEDPIWTILQKLPSLRMHFTTIINLGNGIKPD